VLHKRIDLLPPKFGIWNFPNKEKVLKHNYYQNKKLGIQAYRDDDILKGWRQPSILHFASKKKPWKKFQFNTSIRFFQEWWEYAKKSEEYENIIKIFKKKTIDKK
jgi:lipopolysaccharide biosynthesis glycosyltransferase